jgi:hypothetical protein
MTWTGTKTGLLAISLGLGLAAVHGSALGQSPADPGPRDAPQEDNGYTQYELMAPGTGKFRIIYDITAVRPGAQTFFNPIRKGSLSSDETVTDAATGLPLRFGVVTGAQARASGFPEADLASDYIRVELARPVPQGGGEGRIRIEKTYEDPKSYHVTGQSIEFVRSLGIKRNAVVLPQGYVLSECNVPSQVNQEPDGRLRISFLNNTPAEAPLDLKARPATIASAPSSQAGRFSERAAQTRDIVYSLRDPGSHAFDLYHDYTETRVGVDHYVNVVRSGSSASGPSARDLDTGAMLNARILKGDQITIAGIMDPDLKTITPETEIVVFSFDPVKAGGSKRLRMFETYTDPQRYGQVGDELVFARTFGRPANAVILPKGWILTSTLSPAAISTTDDGRVRLDFVNPRPDEVGVLITARKAQ